MRTRASTRGRMKSRGDHVKKASMLIRVIVIAGIVLLVCLAIVFIYVQVKFTTLNQEIEVNKSAIPELEEPAPVDLPAGLPEIAQDELDEILAIESQTQSPEAVYSNPEAVNILLLGLDTRDPKQFTEGNTDTIIIVTLDTVNNQIKLSSIMRDTLVSVPGRDLGRINTIYHYCGPEALMETVQKYFGVKIDHYAVVNFWAVANIIDSMGGVEVNMKYAEVNSLNGTLDEINKYKGKKSPHVRKGGTQTLDGKQAVAYMRLRHVGEGDFQRTERQRAVLEAISSKDFSLGEILSIVDGLPDNVRTSVGQLEMPSMAKTVLGLKSAPIKHLRLPVEGSYKMTLYKHMSILKVDFEKNAEKLLEFITNK